MSEIVPSPQNGTAALKAPTLAPPGQPDWLSPLVKMAPRRPPRPRALRAAGAERGGEKILEAIEAA
jgi:hypothetical protein